MFGLNQSGFTSRYVKLYDSRGEIVAKRTLKFNDFFPSMEPLERAHTVTVGVSAALDLQDSTVGIESFTPQLAYSKRSGSIPFTLDKYEQGIADEQNRIADECERLATALLAAAERLRNTKG